MQPLNPAPREMLRRRSIQDLARKQLGRIPENLFAGFTGLRFHVAWAPVAAGNGSGLRWPAGCAVCCELAAARVPADPGCLTCDQHHLDGVLRNGKGHHFICRFGMSNFGLPIRVCDEIAGIAYLQALDGGNGHLPPPDGDNPLAPPAFKRLDRHGFAMASRLLRILVRAAEAACIAEIREAELADARQAMVALEQEQSHLHELIGRPVPPPAHLACQHQPNGHADPLPARLLAYLAANFSRPITLHSCADEFGMNAAYLSDVFSRACGVSFKTCLTELRLEKAKELLADPSQRVSAVAYAVGYASENRFRSAFKQATGLPPRVWRQLMQASPPADAP